MDQRRAGAAAGGAPLGGPRRCRCDATPFLVMRKRGRTMRRLVVFNQVTLDGYIADMHGDMSWAHKDDAEWTAFAAENASGGGVLLIGRINYERMGSYWPTPAARADGTAVAEGMKRLHKGGFSRTLD